MPPTAVVVIIGGGIVGASVAYHLRQGGHGVMLAPATGKIMSELIRLGRSDTLDVQPYRLERFATGDLIDDPQI
jgi:glycine/D-amino acid oxidase-like deaminating enzyme